MSTPSMSVPRSKPLRLAVLPRSTTLVNAALVVGGVLFMALFAQISIPLSWTPVPITGGTFAVAIIGTAYGAYLGGLTLFAYYLAGMAGAPFYAEGNGLGCRHGPDGRLPRRLHLRRVRDGLAGGAPLGSPSLVIDLADALRHRRDVRLRPCLAVLRPRLGSERDARGRPLLRSSSAT